MLVLFFALSSVRDATERVEDQRGGDLEDYESMSIDKTIPASGISDIVDKLSITNEIQLYSSNIKAEALPLTVILQYGKKKTNWHVPILKGRYFKQEELVNGKNVAIIVKEIDEKYFSGDSIGKKLTIRNNNYEIVGVYGRKNRETPGGQYAFIPMKSISSWEKKVTQLENEDNTISIGVRRYKGEQGDVRESCINALNGYKASFVSKPDIDMSSVKNTKTLAIILGGSFIIIAGLNLRNLQYYRMLFRKKELAIKYALGSTRRSLIYEIVSESFIIAIFSLFISIALQKLIIMLIPLKLPVSSIQIQYILIIWIVSLVLCVLISLNSLYKVYNKDIMITLGGDSL
jgi:ABC-type antimicrobial peptide transport system, permease component